MIEIEFATPESLSHIAPVPELLLIDRQIGKPYLALPRILNSQAWSRRMELPWTVSHVGPVDNKSVLDVGSGISALPSFFSLKGARVVAVDPLTGRVLQDERISRVKAALPMLPFVDGAFDIVTCVSVLEHLTCDVDEFLRECCRVARERVVFTFDVALGVLARGGRARAEARAIARMFGQELAVPRRILQATGEEADLVGPQLGVCMVAVDVADVTRLALNLRKGERVRGRFNSAARRGMRFLMAEYPTTIKVLERLGRGVRKKPYDRPSGSNGLRGPQRPSVNPPIPPPLNALGWIEMNERNRGGIRQDATSMSAYPEVTGYLIPTMLAYGETELARRLLAWLLNIQEPDGSFPSPTGVTYPFDTAQVLRGLLAGVGLLDGARVAAVRATEYLIGEMVDEGYKGFGRRYAGEVPEPVHLYALPPISRAADVLSRLEYKEQVARCFDYYVHHEAAFEPGILTHYLAYQLDACIELGRPDLSGAVLERVQHTQQEDGAVPGIGGAKWVCTPGLAQLAICWYKLGWHLNADAALKWLEARQEPDGGFKGSYGPQAQYYADTQIPWAVKFYLDAHRLRVKSFFERRNDLVDTATPENDGRADVVLRATSGSPKILEVGCGKGRYLNLIANNQAAAVLHGLDISRAYLQYVPRGPRKAEASMENLPFRADSFDMVFAVEALEHSLNPTAALREMLRVLKPGGTILVVDKERSKWGSLECPPWERWPSESELTAELSTLADSVEVEPVGWSDVSPASRMMLAWKGMKRRDRESPDPTRAPTSTTEIYRSE